MGGRKKTLLSENRDKSLAKRWDAIQKDRWVTQTPKKRSKNPLVSTIVKIYTVLRV